MAPQKQAATPLRPMTHPQERRSWDQSCWPDERCKHQAAQAQSFCVGSASLPLVGFFHPHCGLWMREEMLVVTEPWGSVLEKDGAGSPGALQRGYKGSQTEGAEQQSQGQRAGPKDVNYLVLLQNFHSFSKQLLRAYYMLGLTMMNKPIRAKVTRILLCARSVLSCILELTREPLKIPKPKPLLRLVRSDSLQVGPAPLVFKTTLVIPGHSQV